jgi:hypothetical protein
VVEYNPDRYADNEWLGSNMIDADSKYKGNPLRLPYYKIRDPESVRDFEYAIDLLSAFFTLCKQFSSS